MQTERPEVDTILIVFGLTMKHAAEAMIALDAALAEVELEAPAERDARDWPCWEPIRSHTLPHVVRCPGRRLLPALMPRPPPCPAVLAGDGPLAGAGRPAGGGYSR